MTEKNDLNEALVVANRAAAQAASLWRIAEEPKLVKKLENYTYEVRHGGRDYILRLTEESHRSSEQIDSELHWIAYLDSHGIGVSAPVRSINERFVESIETEQGYLHATLFNKAPGRPLDFNQDWNPQFHRALGELIGRMHRITKTYEPPAGIARRPAWSDNEHLAYPERYLPRSDTTAWRELEEVLEWIESLPITKDSYGLVHQDLHNGNYFIDDRSRLTVFDFDDCEYSWFAYDLAMPLFYFQYFNDLPGRAAESHEWFYDTLLGAYANQNEIGEEWIRRIPGFARFRRIDLYVFIHKGFDTDNLSGSIRVDFERIRETLNRKEPLL